MKKRVHNIIGYVNPILAEDNLAINKKITRTKANENQ